MKIYCFTVLLTVFVAALGFSRDNFSLGEEFFMRNNPAEAVVHFEAAIADDPGNIKAFLFLGIAYEQIGRVEEAITVYRQVLDRGGDLTANIANNLGNAFFRIGNFVEAEAMYNRAIEANRHFAPAILGRANTRIRRGALEDALADYDLFLLLDPRSPQRGEIERLTRFIRAEFAEVERRRLVAEELARAEAAELERRRIMAEELARIEAAEAERRRIAAEEAARLEAERRQRLFDEVAASIQGAAGASQGLSAGSEELEGWESDFELD